MIGVYIYILSSNTESSLEHIFEKSNNSISTKLQVNLLNNQEQQLKYF